MRALKTFIAAAAGATAIEYALLSSLIALVLATMLTNLGGQCGAEFSEVNSALK